jgi:hypothetical protein
MNIFGDLKGNSSVSCKITTWLTCENVHLAFNLTAINNGLLEPGIIKTCLILFINIVHNSIIKNIATLGRYKLIYDEFNVKKKL